MRRSRTATAVAWSVALAATLVAGCAKDVGGSGGASGAPAPCAHNSAPAATAEAPPTGIGIGVAPVNASALRVGMAFDVGGRGDASFNDAAATGLDQAKARLGVRDTRELTAAIGESQDAAQTRLRQLVAGGYNPVISVGFDYAPSVAAVASTARNERFAIVDSTVQGNPPNVTPLLFTEEQGSFLVGAAAALKTRTCHLGFVGGVQTPLIQKFEAGFKQGARAVAPNVKIETSYLTPAGDLSGFNDAPKAQEAAKGQLDAGVDVIYAAAGASGTGVFRAVKATDTAADPRWAIGVDSDQYRDPKLADVRDIILTSMVKHVEVAVYDYISAVASNTLGSLPTVFDLKRGGVGYSTSGGHVDDIKPWLDAYRAAIVNGSIKVSTTP